MIERDLPAPDLRVLVLTSTDLEGDLASSILAAAGVESETFSTMDGLLDRMREGAAAIFLSEESAVSGKAGLLTFLEQQPPWSDLPILVLSDHASSENLSALEALGNVTLLETPMRAARLTNAAKTALRARNCQYELHGYGEALARTEETLQAVDLRADDFLATLGHELRNPLSSILTGLELIRLAGVTQPSARRATAVIERQVNRLSRLIDDLLEVSRITRGVVDVQKELIDLGTVLTAAIEATRGVLDASCHHLDVDLPEQPLIVTGDAVRLTQVFANLLNNAAKYTNAGGQISISAHDERGVAVVTVRDNGIGIEPHLLSSVFEMFTQVDRAHRRMQGGLGIGLTFVRSLVRMHGGTVEARSEGSGTGADFVVRLPLVAARAIAATSAFPIKDFPARRILVVDDNRDASDSLGELLEALGATVCVTHSGEEALAALDFFKPDTVLLDIGMPDMDGYEVARQIRSHPRHRHLLIVALTGWGQDEDRRRSKAAGVDHHLVKPPDIHTLRALLERRKVQRIHA